MASARVRWISPAFEALYGATWPMVRRPRIEPMLTMLPGFFSATQRLAAPCATPVLFRHFQCRLRDRDAGVVPHDVEPTRRLERLGARLAGLHVEIDRR